MIRSISHDNQFLGQQSPDGKKHLQLPRKFADKLDAALKEWCKFIVWDIDSNQIMIFRSPGHQCNSCICCILLNRTFFIPTVKDAKRTELKRNQYLPDNSMGVISKSCIHFSWNPTRYHFCQITSNIHQCLHIHLQWLKTLQYSKERTTHIPFLKSKLKQSQPCWRNRTVWAQNSQAHNNWSQPKPCPQHSIQKMQLI